MYRQNWIASIVEDRQTEYFRDDDLHGSIDGCVSACQNILVHLKLGVSTHEIDHILTICVSSLGFQYS